MASRGEKSSSSSTSNVEDMWTKIAKEKKAASTAAPSSSAANAENENSNAGITVNQNIIFVGDAGSGKTSLIQTFLKPNAAKDTKPTLALDYNYARKTNNNIKSVAHFWEVGGNFLDSGLLEIPITAASLKNSTVAIVCDLSKPHNCIVSILRSISAVREVLSKRMSELQASNVNAVNEIKESVASQLKGHKDGNRLRPTDIPLVIIANKHDTLRSMSLAERKALMQALRFIAHYFGAILLSVSMNDSSMKEMFRGLMNAIGFGGNIKPVCETNFDKAIYITRGQDSYENILLHGFQESAADPSSKVKVIFAKISAFLITYLSSIEMELVSYDSQRIRDGSIFNSERCHT